MNQEFFEDDYGQPPKKPSTFKKVIKWILIGIGVLAVILVVAALFAPSEESESTPESNEYTVGQTFQKDGIGVTLNSATRSEGTEYTKPAEGKVFLLLDWTISNDTDEEFNTFDISFNTYVDGALTDTTYAGEENSLSAADILVPGSRVTGVEGYEVPADFKNVEIRVTNGLIKGDSATFVVDGA